MVTVFSSWLNKSHHNSAHTDYEYEYMYIHLPTHAPTIVFHIEITLWIAISVSKCPLFDAQVETGLVPVLKGHNSRTTHMYIELSCKWLGNGNNVGTPVNFKCSITNRGKKLVCIKPYTYVQAFSEI